MASLPKIFPILCVAFILTGCGGGSSQIIDPSIVLAQPSSNTVAAGSTLQLHATISNSNNTTVLWFVDSLPGGSSTLGTISPQGVYTAPDVPPPGGSVTISAAPQAFPVAVTGITINIAFANVSLSGNYVFTLNGTQGGGPWAVTGTFTADGNGMITNGIEDINGPAGIFQGLAFNGSYVINPNGQGVATFTSSQGSVNVSLTLDSQGQAGIMRTDANTVATGSLFLQSPAALSLTTLNAAYVFGFTGNDQSGKTLSIIGQFTTNGSSTLASAEEDVNDGGTASNQPFSGSYTIGANGRGTATFTDSAGTRSYNFYIVSPGQLQFIETDSSGHLSGGAYQQQNVTSTTTLTASFAFFVAGTDGSSAYGAAGDFTPSVSTSGTLSSGTEDINNGGSIAASVALTGNFTNGAAGRGKLTLSGAAGTANYVFYLITPGIALLMTTDSGINASGQMFVQSGGFSTGALNGYYGLTLASPAGIASPSAAVGTFFLNAAGSLTGSEIENNNGTLSGTLSVSGTYSFSGAALRGQATFTTNGGTSTNFAYYPISNSSVILLGESGSPVVGTLSEQF